MTRADPRRAQANALEALLASPSLLDAEETPTLLGWMDEGFVPFLREAQRQWREQGRLDGARLLELAPTERARAWLGSRLIPMDPDDPTRDERNARVLKDSVEALGQHRRLEESRRLKKESARAGTQGDSLGEVETLNEQLALKRELAARSNTAKGGSQ
jgi:hypothetical protein